MELLFLLLLLLNYFVPIVGFFYFFVKVVVFLFFWVEHFNGLQFHSNQKGISSQKSTVVRLNADGVPLACSGPS